MKSHYFFDFFLVLFMNYLSWIDATVAISCMILIFYDHERKIFNFIILIFGSILWAIEIV